MSVWTRSFYESKCMFFWKKIMNCYKNIIKSRIKSAIILKKIDSKPVKSENYLRAKVKYYKGKVNAIFYIGKIPKEDSHFICLWMTLFDSLLEKDWFFIKNVFSYIIRGRILQLDIIK